MVHVHYFDVGLYIRVPGSGYVVSTFFFSVEGVEKEVREVKQNSVISEGSKAF